MMYEDGLEGIVSRMDLRELCLFSLQEKKRGNGGCQVAITHCLKGRVTEKTEASQSTSTGCKGVSTGHRDFFLIRVLEPRDQDQAGQEGLILTSFQSIQQPVKCVLLGTGDWTRLLQTSIHN